MGPRRCPGWVGEPSRGSGKVWIPSSMFGRVGGNGSGYPWGGLGRVVGTSRWPGTGWGPSERSETGRRTLLDVRDGSGDPLGGAGWMGGNSGRSMPGQGTLVEVRDESEDPRGGPERVGGTTGMSGTDQQTLREVRDGSGTLGEVRERSGYRLVHSGGSVETGWPGMGWGTLK